MQIIKFYFTPIAVTSTLLTSTFTSAAATDTNQHIAWRPSLFSRILCNSTDYAAYPVLEHVDFEEVALTKKQKLRRSLLQVKKMLRNFHFAWQFDRWYDLHDHDAALADNSADKTVSKRSTHILSEKERKQFAQMSTRLFESVHRALGQDDIWDLVYTDEDTQIRIWRTHVDIKTGNGRSDVPIIKSEMIMNASPKKVFDLFMDNDRVHEYNDNCVLLQDLEIVDSKTKINWCATGKFGPFMARDFVTLVHYCEYGKEGFASVASHVDHENLPPADGFVRSQIQLAATFMEPIKGEPQKTRFIQVTQVGELGGVANNSMAKKITANLAEKAPIDFLKKFNKALKNKPVPRKPQATEDLPFDGVGNIFDFDA